MRVAILCLLFAVAGTLPAFAGPCAGVKEQLARVSAKLTLGDVSGA